MKQLICIILAFVTISSFAGSPGYVITGEVKAADGQTVVLKQIKDLKPADIGSATVTNGKFTLKGTTPNPEFCLLYVGDKGPVQFFVENSNIHITVDLENLENSKVTGSGENDVFTEFIAGIGKFSQKQKQLNAELQSLKTSAIANPEAGNSVAAQIEKLQEERNNYMINFVMQHPGKVSTAFIVNNVLLSVLNAAQLGQVVKGYPAVLESSQWVKMLNDNFASLRRTEIGQPFPDITLKTPDDKPVSLSNYAGKGKYVLIDFWASWCGPCRNANPQVVELYKRYKDKGFEIVGISLDRGKTEWVEAIRNDNLAWPHMSDLNFWQSAAAKLYSVSSIPYTVLLDKDGKIIAKGLHVGELGKKLAELMD